MFTRTTFSNHVKQCYTSVSENFMGTKAVRFTEKEEKMINTFLETNPFFDFSTLARISILKFIQNPEITLKPITYKNIEENKFEKVRMQ
jgi:hypothetical protein